ncbi:SRPBCC family protein [Streptomyces radicis]|uniref:SRPBCC family protein n=1 Tax=Streptomyces radicis TaxID=1750517 RepID=A0A3A9W7S3_9ACTN|nr:SRPBCC family protein [Streptomyces radicis]RKN08423.1 SRPBCC family protein [Streptomyces radicis]RKN21541.1 SRPBCC family protein [Streptomyces radicis]
MTSTEPPVPTGQLLPTDTGYDLILTRTYRGSIDDVWASVTEPERTARWFGPWRGEAAPGRTIEVRMAFEAEAPWCAVRIDACEPPRRLAVSMDDEAGSWPMELLLDENGDGGTTLRLVHHRPSAEGIGEIGPGWEYYLGLLTASREGGAVAAPDFDAYYPAQKAYYEGLAPTP